MDNTTPKENFELSFRLLGNEVIGLRLSSESQRKNWIFIAAIYTILLAVLANALLPVITAIATLVQ